MIEQVLQREEKMYFVGGGGGVHLFVFDMISGCAAKRKTVMNAAFPDVLSAGLHVSRRRAASQPCQHNSPVVPD